MTKDEKEVELTVQDALIDKVGSERFELWFGRGVRWEFSESTLRITTSDSFMSERVRALFHQDLQAVAERLWGRGVSVQYEWSSDLQSPSAESCTAPTASPVSLLHPQAKAHRQQEDHERAVDHQAKSPAARRPKYGSLPSFVRGISNKVAHVAAITCVQQLGDFSPLFLWGPAGTGKTHLMQGIWQATRKQSRRRALYMTAEQFTSLFVAALHGSGLPSFRHKCRSVDVLLIDDVHFFVQKRATLVELQHTIDALTREGKQMVLAADRSPAELSQLGPELATRLAGGLVCQLDVPDRDTRRGIVQRFAAEHRASIHADVLDFIAEEFPGDARQLRGAINQVVAASLATQQSIDLHLARTTLLNLLAQSQRVVNLGDIDRAVCDVFGLKPQSLQSSRRSRTVSQPRMLAMWLARKYTGAVFAEIGEYFGRRSHSTVISAHKTVSQWVDNRQDVKLAGNAFAVDEVIRRVEARLRLA